MVSINKRYEIWNSIFLNVLVTTLAIVVGCALFVGNLAFAQGKTVQVTDGVYSWGDGVFFSLFYVTDEGVIAVDPFRPDHSKGLFQAIREVTSKPVRYLVYTHDHWDHSSGGRIFQEAGAIGIAHVLAAESMESNQGPDMVLPEERWAGDRRDIILGGKTMRLHYFGANHGKGMTIVELPAERVLYISDMVTPKRIGFTIMPDFTVRGWIRSLVEMEKLSVETVVVSHGTGPQSTSIWPQRVITEQREFLQDLQSAIVSAMQAGENPFMIPQTVRLPKYKDWAFYDEWLEMNAWRVMLEMWMGW